jgi:hydrogenase-4 component B
MIAAHVAFWTMVAGYTGGGLAALVSRSGRSARLATAAGGMLGSAAAFVLALAVLLSGNAFELSLPRILEAAGGIALRLDALGGWFLLVVAAGGFPASLYGASYTAEYEGAVSLRAFGLFFNAFLLAMALVTCAGNVLTFLLAWELMSLGSYLLVMTEARHSETRLAGLWYIGMAEFGVLALLPMFLLLAPASSQLAFADLRAGALALTPTARNVVFALALVGFGSKAGLVPLHVWLPRAHPAAPSHVSALMSGVMIKLGIYGIVRVVFDLMGGGPPWWGGLLLAIGSVSALLGVLYALMEHDLKRLLAYHSVENIGIIVIGLGAGSLLHSHGLHALAAIGFAGALFHCLNHACFKSLLFLGAGNILNRAHTRNMEEMGGLIKRMPHTAVQFLIGSIAISALPPLNGFASEWMVFQALLGGTFIPRPEIAASFPVAIGMLALTSGLAAACFVKAFGISFLAMPRSSHASDASEVPVSMRVSGWLLAGACVALGLGSSVVTPVLYRILNSVDGLVPDRAIAPAPGVWMQAPGALGRMSPFLMSVLLAAVVIVVVVSVRRLHRLPARVSDTWGCGRVAQTPRMEYTATSFAEPLRRVFAELYRPTRDLTVTVHPDSSLFVQSMTFTSEVRSWAEEALYHPLFRAWVATAWRVRRLQAGSVHLYLLYVSIALIAALTSVWWLS